jgi:hypothetical protein
MKQIACVFLFIVFYALPAAAQDVIVRRDSSRSLVKIIEIHSDYIRYQAPASSVTLSAKSGELAYIRLENGFLQKFEPASKPKVENIGSRERKYYRAEDSLRYFSRPKSIAVNYLCFINREFGLLFQREYLHKHLSLFIPFTIGLDRPVLTQKYYFKNNFNYTVQHKLFDTGIGLNYFPSYRSKANFFIGPVLRAQFFRGEQVLLPYTNSPLIVKKSILSRMSLSVTTGYLLRTKSRLQLSVFTSLGLCADFVPFKIRRPVDNKPVNPISDPVGFYFWTGFLVGYCF